ncbi:TIGR02594, TIGR02594 family protein [uncultured Caudovirales phage]|uniref:TIGR02594, TIGR02594 family protein n=1 Tax=uncultured Caudovirales phage TaxID=2100421 RepID=A0A6J5M7S9_9CAUD|nr:TIGR02594, TIGR02594 family protein [uncultured Caudovirales phage]
MTNTNFPNGTAARILEVALAEVGTIEEGDNLTKYGKFTKADGLPWCGSFCNWVFAQAGVKVHSVVSTPIGAHKFKETSRWHEKPAIGDLAFMDFPHDGVDRISHVGIVVGIEGNTITTIEGNTSGAGGDQRNGGMVMVKQRTIGKEVVGFGRPKLVAYSGEYPKIDVPQAPKKLTRKGKK